MTLLADLVRTSQLVAGTSARSAKVAALADLIRRLEPQEVDIVVAILSGEARQGRIGIGWATVSAVQGAPADGATTAFGPRRPALTVAELDHTLDRLAVVAGPGSVTARTDAVAALFARATADEAEFLTRLLLGDLRQGALAGIMAEAVAKAAGVPAAAVRRAAMLAGDLCRVAGLAMTGGVEALVRVTLRPLSPVLPMLAASSPDVRQALRETGPASIDWKLDGARVQVHRDGDDVRIYTRNLNEVTSRMPHLADLARSFPATCFILDGEALGWADDGERPGRFQESMSSFGRHDPASAGGGATLAARFFDILHLDGEDLIDRPLHERMEVLDRLVGEWRVPSIRTDDPEVAQEFFDGALAAGHEGVMVKAVSSPYDAGRRGGAWRKVKPVQTFDLVVLGAEWGHGRRHGWLSNLHLGARGPDGDFVMVGKTFKGLTDELLAWQTQELLARGERRSGITVHVRPELVVEIALDGVQSSTRYPGGLALRFARVRRYRPDKSPADADTIESLRRLLIQPGLAADSD